MVQPTVSTPVEPDIESLSSAQMVHTLLRMVLAVRYRKNLVAAVMAAAALLGGLYYVTATRLYSAKAGLLVTQTRPDHLDTSITNEESVRQNSMPTFENMVCSAKVVEGALKNLRPATASIWATGPRSVASPFCKGSSPPRRSDRRASWR